LLRRCPSHCSPPTLSLAPNLSVDRLPRHNVVPSPSPVGRCAKLRFPVRSFALMMVIVGLDADHNIEQYSLKKV
jgi:hypothetical protein